jgi:hypothetical protein
MGAYKLLTHLGAKKPGPSLLLVRAAKTLRLSYIRAYEKAPSDLGSNISGAT